MTREEAIQNIKKLIGFSDTLDESISTLFPELKESEDERIRKELLAVINDLVLPDEQKARFNAYLEKQKEQKPVEWSEEDKEHLKSIISTIERVQNDEDETAASVLGYYESDIAWLKSLPERFNLQPKNEWSKEDLQHKSWILECLADGERKMPEYAEDFRAAYKWLKSLRPSWKPSDGQMAELNKVRTLNPGLDALYQQLKNM